MGSCKTPADKFLLWIGVGVNTKIAAAKDKEDHQKNQKQKGMEKSNATKIKSGRSLHLEGFNKINKKS